MQYLAVFGAFSRIWQYLSILAELVTLARTGPISQNWSHSTVLTEGQGPVWPLVAELTVFLTEVVIREAKLAKTTLNSPKVQTLLTFLAKSLFRHFCNLLSAAGRNSAGTRR